jgi:hypothetical protein
MQRKIINFRADDDFRKHLEAKARENDMAVGAYIKQLLKKHSKYKEKKPTLL